MRGTAIRSALLAVMLVFGVTSIAPVHAGDRVAELTKVLTTSSNDKTRLAAVVALAKLAEGNEKRAMKPLVGALSDPNPQIRAVAATGLGKLGHKAALPQLKNTANDDLDATVREKAKEAAVAVAKANDLPDPWPTEAVAAAPKKGKKAKAGFGNEPRAIEPEGADTYVLINSSMDDSPGKADKKTRQANADILRNFLMAQFRANPMLTTLAEDAQKKSLTARHLDLSVVKLDVVTGGTHVEVEAQLRLAISDGNGKMLSFVSGGAKVQVAKNKFQPKYLPSMRREVLEGAMRGLYDKLLTQLRDRSQS